MNIGIIGTGYVGLVTGCCLADTGNNILCMDISEDKVAKMNAGKVPIYEPGLEYIFQRNQKQKRLFFTTSLKEVVENSSIIFLCLPTPQGADGFADLRYILKVTSDMIPYINEYKIIIDKSTVPIGTAEKLQEIFSQAQKQIDVVSNPEFLREGYAVEDFMKPERIVIGTNSKHARKILHTLYSPYIHQGNSIFFTDERTAELSKYAANSFLASKISFINEIAILSEKLGANVDMIRKIMGADKRIGESFLYAGIGYGGSCFPKDVQALAKISQSYGLDFKIIEAILKINQRQQEFFYSKILLHFQGQLKNCKLGVWGLAFKPNTDDIREAPAIKIIDLLLEQGAKIQAYDPEAMPNYLAIYGNKIQLTKDMYSAVEDVDALIIFTEWSEFRFPNWDIIKKNMHEHTIFDGRNIFTLELMQEQAFTYYNIGRGDIKINTNSK